MNRHAPTLLAAIVIGFTVVLGACSGGAASTAGSGGPGASSAPSPSAQAGPVTTPDQALARVVAAEPRIAGIKAHDANAIGQAAWYEVTPASGVGAFLVKIHLGWGDCPAGCISQHSWLYAVMPDGTVNLQSQDGDAVPPDAWPVPASGSISSGLLVTVSAGPTCPVERPNDPACAPRPVQGAVIVIRDAGGAEKGSVTSGADGTATIDLPAGEYTLEPQPVQGLMHAAAPMRVTVGDGGPTEVTILYDTGIR